MTLMTPYTSIQRLQGNWTCNQIAFNLFIVQMEHLRIVTQLICAKR